MSQSQPPEQSPSPEENQPTPRNANGLLILLLFLGVLFVFTSLFESVPGSTVPYSEFMEAAEEGRILEVVISEDAVVWMEKEGDETVRYRAKRVPGVEEAPLLEQLHAHGVKVTGAPPDSIWNSLFIWLVPLLLLVFFWSFFVRRASVQTEALSFGRSRARLWEEGSEQVTFENVAGVDEAVAELCEVVDFLQNPEKYTRIGAHIPKGVILVGPPGTGKTLLARATAGEAGVPFFSISGADFVEMFVGVGAARARDLFRQARAKAPCIVFIDEIDALGRRRAGARAPVTNEEREQTLNQLLVEIDGFDSSAGVIIMAATNRPDLLDPALLRPGRFDRQVVVDKPDLNGREAILQVHVQSVKLAAEVDLHVIAARTPGFAGAELANVVNEAALLAVRRGRQEVSMEDLDEAVDRVLAGLERKSRALIPREREIVAHHEMGHALLGMLLPHADPVHKVSIVPRGVAALGATIQAPLEDRYLLTEAELYDRMAVVLGGRAAEEVAFGEISTGAADDLQRATTLARRMVTQFGMSRGMGPVALEEMSESLDGASFLANPRTYSEETTRKVDAEIGRMVGESYERAKSLLRKHRQALLNLSAELLACEVMDGAVLAQRLEALGIHRISPERVRRSTSDLPDGNGSIRDAKQGHLAARLDGHLDKRWNRRRTRPLG